MSKVHGPDFLALQVRDVERAAAFYERELGLERAQASPPGVVAFRTSPIVFAVREPLPGTNLDAGPVALGVSISLSTDDAQGLHDRLKEHEVSILVDPFDTPFGRTFVFQDLDGYAIRSPRGDLDGTRSGRRRGVESGSDGGRTRDLRRDSFRPPLPLRVRD